VRIGGEGGGRSALKGAEDGLGFVGGGFFGGVGSGVPTQCEEVQVFV